MAISRPDFWFFIIELVTRNPNLGIPALENGLFANLLIFDYSYYIFFFGGREQGREKGKGKGKGKREGKRKGNREGKGKREGNYEDSEGTLMRSRVYRYTRLHCKGVMRLINAPFLKEARGGQMVIFFMTPFAIYI